MKRALITGITGQDGSYLAEFLLARDYEVHGVIRCSSSQNTGRLDALRQAAGLPAAHLRLHLGDLEDGGSLQRVLREARPDEVYHLGAQSHVQMSFEVPEYTGQVTGLGTLRLLDAIRASDRKPRFYQASSSEIFGDSAPPQTENTPHRPCSPYAAAKLYAHWTTIHYRRAYGLFACNGILFNHESPRRGELFVSRKITRAAARIKLGLQSEVRLGNLDARRDWGFAGDYVEAMWRMLQQDRPDDYVIATGVSHTVREFAQAAFAHLNLDWRDHVVVDPSLLRPTDAADLRGDMSKAKQRLDWGPRVPFGELVSMMVDADLELAVREQPIVSDHRSA